ncbi:MAG: hypothetical protein LLG37_09345 [Spirochaetia bacterium]|nr:hypothetical protein [Spirochaetia bacterium]
MLTAVFIALASAILILCGAELLSNSISAGVPRFKVRESAVFLLSCAGASLPEVIIPLLAASRIPDMRGDMAAAGAILGAPLMLSTLAFGVIGTAVVIFAVKNKRPMTLTANAAGLSFGLFMLATAFCAAALLITAPPVMRKILSPVFIIIYACYVYRVISYPGGQKQAAPAVLYMSAADMPPVFIIVLQGVIGTCLVAGGASLFVRVLSAAAPGEPGAVFVMAAIAVPVITELPEIWRTVKLTAGGDDADAISVVMNSLFFQAGIILFIGVVFTQWQPGEAGRAAALTTAVTAAFTGLLIRAFNRVHALMFIPGLLAYGAAIYYLIRAAA